MKKGFTLIELLAVIVILAIIALIATPIVLNIINDAKESAVLRSAEFYVDGVEHSIATAILKNKNITDNTYNIKDGDICLNDDCTDKLEVAVDGKTPEVGTITITNGNITGLNITLEEKEIYKNSKGELVYLKKLNDICKPAKKQFFATNPLEAGYEYECEVKPGTKYNFYILSTEEDGSINLIMDRNINSDGSPTTKSIFEGDKDTNGGIYNLFAWVSKEDYNDDTNYGEYGNNDKGPITAMTFLNNATSDWSNIPNLNLSYNDEGEHFTNFKITGKARLPYLSEVNDYNGTNGYLYNHLHAECYDSIEDSNPVACDEAGHIEYGVVEEGIEQILDIHGYWILSSDADYSDFVGIVSSFAEVSNDVVDCDVSYGARPVINLKY